MMTQMEEEVHRRSCSDQKVETESSIQIEENVVKFLDSIDDYLIFMSSLSSTLRQGWLELASARHSMGALRINSALFDLKCHSAATTLEVNQQCVFAAAEQPVFKLHKWASSDSSKSMCSDSYGQPVHHNSTPENSDIQDNRAGPDGSPASVHNQVQKERLKRLSVFGALFSPKLQAAQLSFETALETLVEISNRRASLLAAYEQVCKETESTTK